MTKIKALTVTVFVCVAIGILALIIFPAPWKQKKTGDTSQTRIVIPESLDLEELIDESLSEGIAGEDQMSVKVPLGDGETLVTVLTDDFDGDFQDEQFVAYRNLAEAESPVYLTYIDNDGPSGSYRQVWNAPTAATRPGTVSVYTEDLTGDRSLCVLTAGINGNGENTLTVFRKNSPPNNTAPGANAEFTKIADLRIDGSIQVRETARSQAYQMGVTKGVSFPIAAYGTDHGSSNIMDQLEFIYTYNERTGLYEQSRITKVPGIQIEQRRVQELLRSSRAFEDFITGLWYYIGPDGTIDSRQYIHFDPQNREIIFFGDETQQVFVWQNSSASRFGLHIASQNISVTTLRRSIDIELQSLESIRIKVFEDVRMKIGVNAPWDGSYRKAEPLRNPDNGTGGADTYISAVYDSPAGRFSFSPDGNYKITTGGNTKEGKYAFFYLDNEEILEMRAIESITLNPENSRAPRETYMVLPEAAGEETAGEEGEEIETDGADSELRKNLSLSKIRLGVRGIEQLHEGTITLSLVEE